MIDAEQLARLFDCPIKRTQRWAGPLNAAMQRYDVNSPKRQAAFLAQIGHESGRLQYVQEIWNPSQCPWQAQYEGKAKLGNTQLGDGARFKGRGLLQITGRTNYRACGKALGLDLEQAPEQLKIPQNAALSAAWYWQAYGCNGLADAGDFRTITQVINGGFNGIEDRLKLWERVKRLVP